MFRGDKIYFRIITSDDVDLILTWENNPVNWKVSSISKSFTRQQIIDFVNAEQDIYIHGQIRLIICLIDTNEVIGNIDLFDFEPEHKRVGVGILIDEKYRHKGLATVSIQLIEEYCKVLLGIRNIFCNILTDSTVSIKLFEKNNYKRIGIKPNWHLYNNEWFDEIFYIKNI